MSNIENEQMYLDMVGQLKDKFDEVEQKLDTIEKRDKQLRKDFITAYGTIRLLDHLISNSPVGFDDEVVIMVEVLRGFLSDCVDNHFF
jgi:chromosome condensin MukBEF ATPase and DNA-binding subunit MukB